MGLLAGCRLAGGLADTVYWINTGDNTIRAAPLAGGGSVDTLYGSAQGVDLALGIAISSAAGRIHWTNYGDSTIRGAPLAGGGTVDTLYDSAQGVTDPVKVAIDPAAGWLYWTGNYGNGEIQRAPLAGGTVDTLYGPPQGVFAPTGVAIDPAGGRIYWSDSGYGTILGAPLAAGGTVNTLYGPAPGGRGDRRCTDRPEWRSTQPQDGSTGPTTPMERFGAPRSPAAAPSTRCTAIRRGCATRQRWRSIPPPRSQRRLNGPLWVAG